MLLFTSGVHFQGSMLLWVQHEYLWLYEYAVITLTNREPANVTDWWEQQKGRDNFAVTDTIGFYPAVHFPQSQVGWWCWSLDKTASDFLC